MEREGFALERIDRVFRAFHTLKGSAGVVNLPAMALTLHAAEDLLAAIHAGTARRDLGHRRPGAGLSRPGRRCGSMTSRLEERCRRMLAKTRGAMAERLRDLLPGPASEADMTSDRRGPATAADGGLPEWVSRLIAAEQRANLPAS